MKQTFQLRFSRKTKHLFTNELVRFSLLGISCILIAATLMFFVEGQVKDTQVKSLGDALWLSVSTFTTTGYGDKVPVTWWGRAVMGMLMFSGLFVVALIAGQIAGVLVQQSLERARGFINMEKKKNHFVICGWKRDMEKVVEQILIRNDELTPEDIVVIANLPDDQLMTIKLHPLFKSIDIIKGDYFNESVLNRANVKYAAKVLILADDNKNVSVTEVDSRTVMTAMTIENIARDTYVLAELLDRKFEPYLRMAKVDEIVLSREYGRSLIANTCLSSGIAHVVHDLLDVNCPTTVTTKPIADAFVGKNFSSLSEHYHEKKAILIGILENTGNVFKMKRDAINDAQKNADISKIVEKLKETKSLKSNHPILNPDENYVIQKNSSAILIETLFERSGVIVT